MRDTARAPQPPTDPQIGHQISLHGLAQIDQKCQFWAQFGRFLAKNPFLYWRNQKLCYPHNRKPTQAPCSQCWLVEHWTKCAKNGNIWPKMTKNADFGPNLAVFGPKILIFMGVSKSFGTNITETTWTICPHRFWSAWEQMGQNKHDMPILRLLLLRSYRVLFLSAIFSTKIKKNSAYKELIFLFAERICQIDSIWSLP